MKCIQSVNKSNKKGRDLPVIYFQTLRECLVSKGYYFELTDLSHL
jgi:hypothetical protein